MADDSATYEATMTEMLNDEANIAEECEYQEELDRRRRYYPSNKMGQYIANASYGHRYPWKVGSYDSLKLYRVTDSSGMCDGSGIRLTKSDNHNQEPNNLYFNSPEEYERVMRTKLSPEGISRWKNMMLRLFGRMPDGENSWATCDRDIDMKALQEIRVEAKEAADARNTAIANKLKAEFEAYQKRKNDKAEAERIMTENLIWAKAENKAINKKLMREQRLLALRKRNKKKHMKAKERRRTKNEKK